MNNTNNAPRFSPRALTEMRVEKIRQQQAEKAREFAIQWRKHQVEIMRELKPLLDDLREAIIIDSNNK